MTTELVILLMLFVFAISRFIGLPGKTFDEAGPRLGLRIEKHIETGHGFWSRTQGTQNPVSWRPSSKK